MDPLDFVRDLAVVTLIAAVAGWGCRRIGLSVVVGYLCAGMVIGPHTPPFQLITDRGVIDLLAQLGLVFLVFSIGLELRLGRLQRLTSHCGSASAAPSLGLIAKE